MTSGNEKIHHQCSGACEQDLHWEPSGSLERDLLTWLVWSRGATLCGSCLWRNLVDPLKSLSHPLSLGPPGVVWVPEKRMFMSSSHGRDSLEGSGRPTGVRPMAAEGWPTMGQRCRDFSPSNAQQLLERVPFPTLLGSGLSNEPLGASAGGVILTE